jgi:hypothetical protein
MKKIILMSCFSVTVLTLFSGCGKSAINCDDSEAKNLVMQITEGEFKNQLTMKLNPYISSYEQLKKINPSDEVAKKNKQELMQTIDKQYVEMSPKLVNIRTDKLDDELEKSECSADIEFVNGNKAPITYGLSKTSEGKLYADVFGLR